MERQDRYVEDVFENLVKTGVLSTGNAWIQRAAAQKNPRLTLELAYSSELTYDITDRLMMKITDMN